MKKRIIAVLLVLCMCAGLIPGVSAEEPTMQDSVNLEALVAHGISLFKDLEAGGEYDSVVNTYSCVGMGIMGWIGSAALQLLKWCASPEKGGDPEFCRSVLGEDLYNEVVNAPVAIQSTLMPNWNYWRYRRFSDSELAAAKELLGSEVGIRVQNALAECYLLTQAQHGWDAGVRTESALIYYCSVENHYGEGGAEGFMSSVREALGLSSTDLIISLDQFHQGAELAEVSTIGYRRKVYNYLTQTLGLPSGPDDGSPAPTEPSEPTNPTEPVVPFTDLPDPDHWSYDAIIWAYTNDPQITAGTSETTFSPDEYLTRGQAMTFLWAAAGKPQPLSHDNPFEDVHEGDYFLDPILWAVENHITAGTSETTFSPYEYVTTGQMLTFLWVFAGRPIFGELQNPFQDVSSDDYFYHPVLWGYYGGILVGNEGNGADLLMPYTPCTRAYVVTYLYDYFMNEIH